MEGHPQETPEEEELCSCCPYGYHIHTDFVKFAEDKLSVTRQTSNIDKIVKTIHPPKDSKLWCSQTQSINSMMMINGQLPPPENITNSSKVSKKPVKSKSALIQRKILDLQESCAPRRSIDEIYGSGLLDAIKEFEDFVSKTWGRRRRSRSRACTVSFFDPTTQQEETFKKTKKIIEGGNQSNGHDDVCAHCQRQCSCKTDTVPMDQQLLSDLPVFSTTGVNTELAAVHITIGTNTVASEPTPPVCRTGPLSKLTIPTHIEPRSQTPDCGGDSGGYKDEIMKPEQVEATSSTEEFTEESAASELELNHSPQDPSPDMASALKLVNDALVRGRTGRDVVQALSVVQDEWFRIIGKKDAHASDVVNYLNTFENHSAQLLRYMVNIPDVHGITALHYSVSYGNFPAVSKLLDTNVVDPNKPNKAGYTSIMLASLAEIKTAQQEKTVKRLISLGNVNIKAAQHGQTALMLAASHGRFKMVKLLLQGGADVNAQDEDGSTALMCAVEHGHADIVQCLLAQHGGDPNLADNDGLTALNVAMDAGHKDIAVMLYAHMHFIKSSRESPPKTPIADSLVLSKRSRSATNVRPMRSGNNNGRRISMGNNAELQSVARKQRSSIN